MTSTHCWGEHDMVLSAVEYRHR